jgi:hypothetical protein
MPVIEPVGGDGCRQSALCLVYPLSVGAIDDGLRAAMRYLHWKRGLATEALVLTRLAPFFWLRANADLLHVTTD